jgi:hypothetical protein
LALPIKFYARHAVTQQIAAHDDDDDDDDDADGWMGPRPDGVSHLVRRFIQPTTRGKKSRSPPPP